MINKIKSILKKANGETLMEGIVSILVFTILIATITMMILVTLDRTNKSNDLAIERQDDANAALSSSLTSNGTPSSITFVFGSDSTNPIVIPVKTVTESEFIAFGPSPTPIPDP